MIHPAAERKGGRFGGKWAVPRLQSSCRTKGCKITSPFTYIGDEAMQLDMVKRPDEEEEDLESAQVDE